MANRTKEQNREYMRKYRAKCKANQKDIKKEYIKKWDGLCNIILSLIYGIINFTANEPFSKSTDNNYSDSHILNMESIYKYLNISKKMFDTRIKWLESMGILEKVVKVYPTKKAKNIQWAIRLNIGLIKKLIEEQTIRIGSYDSIYSKVIDYWKSLPEKDDLNNNLKEEFVKRNKWATQYNYGTINFLDTTKSKLCGRYFSKLCLTKNPDKHDTHPLERYYMLDDLFNLPHLTNYEEYKERYVECDTNANSLRLTIDLIHRHLNQPLLDKDIDIYLKYLYRELTNNKKAISDKDFHDSKEREVLKLETQSLLQGLKSIQFKKKVINNIRYSGKEKEFLENLQHKEIITKQEWETKKLLDRATEIEILFGVRYDKFLNELKEAYYKLIRVGNLQKKLHLGNKYFLIEGCVFGEIRKYLASKNITVYQVYDGVYGLKGQLTDELFYQAWDYAINSVYELLGEEQINEFIKPHKYGKIIYDELTDTNIIIDDEQAYKELLHDVKTLGDDVYNKFLEFSEPRKKQINYKVADKWFTQLVQLSSTDIIPSINQSIQNNYFGFYKPKYNNFNFNTNSQKIQMSEIEQQKIIDNRLKEGKRIVY